MERVQKTKTLEMSISPTWHQMFSILQFDEADGLCQNHQQYRLGAKYLHMIATFIFSISMASERILRRVFRRHDWRLLLSLNSCSNKSTQFSREILNSIAQSLHVISFRAKLYSSFIQILYVSNFIVCHEKIFTYHMLRRKMIN